MPGPKPKPKTYRRFPLYLLSMWMRDAHGQPLGHKALERLKVDHPHGFPERLNDNGNGARSFCPREVLNWVRSIGRSNTAHGTVGAKTQYELWSYAPGRHKTVWDRPKGAYLDVDDNGEPILP